MTLIGPSPESVAFCFTLRPLGTTTIAVGGTLITTHGTGTSGLTFLAPAVRVLRSGSQAAGLASSSAFAATAVPGASDTGVPAPSSSGSSSVRLGGSSGLSTGTKVGIGVGAGVGGLLVLVLVVGLSLWMRRRRRTDRAAETTQAEQ